MNSTNTSLLQATIKWITVYRVDTIYMMAEITWGQLRGSYIEQGDGNWEESRSIETLSLVQSGDRYQLSDCFEYVICMLLPVAIKSLDLMTKTKLGDELWMRDGKRCFLILEYLVPSFLFFPRYKVVVAAVVDNVFNQMVSSETSNQRFQESAVAGGCCVGVRLSWPPFLFFLCCCSCFLIQSASSFSFSVSKESTTQTSSFFVYNHSLPLSTFLDADQTGS